jgi:hypothetical protein
VKRPRAPLSRPGAGGPVAGRVTRRTGLPAGGESVDVSCTAAASGRRRAAHPVTKRTRAGATAPLVPFPAHGPGHAARPGVFTNGNAPAAFTIAAPGPAPQPIAKSAPGVCSL